MEAVVNHSSDIVREKGLEVIQWVVGNVGVVDTEKSTKDSVSTTTDHTVTTTTGDTAMTTTDTPSTKESSPSPTPSNQHIITLYALITQRLLENKESVEEFKLLLIGLLCTISQLCPIALNNIIPLLNVLLKEKSDVLLLVCLFSLVLSRI